jgi:XTP/dITP diphosphohydrolase
VNDLLIATNNRGKLAEIELLLSGLSLDLVSLAGAGITDDVEETGDTFAENAAIKAMAYAISAGIPALADDSGLMIDSLGGAPGVHSARYAGPEASDRDRIDKVLSELRDSARVDRTARFVCVVALANANGEVVHTTEGVCEGRLADRPRGDNGFGYDPIFVPDGYEMTFGELPSDEKQKISHRARAVRKMIPFLRGFFKT